MEWKKNDSIELEIEDIGDTGDGVGKTDGFIWFVKDTVVGDRVEARVMKVGKSYGYARLVNVLRPSPFRIAARCPVARQCGGCQLQVMSYEEQLKYKKKKVMNNLRRIGGFESVPSMSLIGMENPWRYRNKAQFPFGRNREGKIITGFYAAHSHMIIENEDCLLGIEENSPILSCIKQFMEDYQIEPYDERSHSGLVRHALIRKGFHTGELMVCLVINGPVRKLKRPEVLAEWLRERYGDRMVSVSCSINKDRTNVIMGDEIVHLYGPGYIMDEIGGVRYRISPLSFYQVNPLQTERLYRVVREYALLTGKETVWDLYCGIGTISLFLAKNAKRVYGVEIIPQAVDDARANAALNGITNAGFFVGKAEEVLCDRFEKKLAYADVVVVDPPRKGCDRVCLDTILKMAPERVVYVSCDSATLARDLKYLCGNGYVLDRGTMVDMFGWSIHTECVVGIQRKHM